MRGLTKSEKLQKNMREQKGDELGGVNWEKQAPFVQIPLMSLHLRNKDVLFPPV